MSIKQHFARWKETEAAKLRPMTPKQRAGYILHYYRFWFIGLAPVSYTHLTLPTT